MAKEIKFMFLIMILATLCSCAALDYVLGVDENGKDKEGTPPAYFIIELLQSVGPLGVAVAGALTVGGSAYVGRKRGQKVGDAVIAGVQKARNEMSPEESDSLKAELKKHIPNKFHEAIRKVKDTI